MSDAKHDQAEPGEIYDKDLDLKAILVFAGSLAAVMLVVLGVMWWMSNTFKQEEEAKDHAPSPLAEARLDPIPPGPRLQPSPPRDMDELRARDREVLMTYGWVDQANGIARIPVARAMEILADKGLPPTPPADKGLPAGRPAEPAKEPK